MTALPSASSGDLGAQDARTFLGRALLIGSLAFSTGLADGRPALAQAAPATKAPGVIGLAIGDWRFALYETPQGKLECPDGFQSDLSANYKAQFPTPEARKAREQQFGYYTNRGPNGENVFYHPTVITDPLPFRAIQGATALGMNLDGETEGKGAGPSIPHGNFTSPSGERGIDNQLYRVIGCTVGWRKGGGISEVAQIFMRQGQGARTLLEITGVDDETNDDQVTITAYRGLDPVAADSADRLIPWLSQRIDYKYGRRYISRFQGRIVDGILITEPMDLRLPLYEKPNYAGDRVFRKARLRLKLTPTGAEGLLGGYLDLEQWYLMYAKMWGAHKVADIEGWSGPATYRALRQFADYRDPATGQVDGVSAAYEVGFTRAFIVHTPQSDAVIAEVVGPQRAAPMARTASR